MSITTGSDDPLELVAKFGGDLGTQDRNLGTQSTSLPGARPDVALPHIARRAEMLFGPTSTVPHLVFVTAAQEPWSAQLSDRWAAMASR